MSTSVTPPRFIERRKPPQKNHPKEYGWILFLIAITLVMVIGYVVSHGHPYKPGDTIGYNLGLAGGIMMSTILLYPLRKRMSFMKTWIILPKWFQLHMIFGVMGPAIIMLHSTFYIGSINAGVAMVCMLLVSGSGIFGRFFYTKVHYGLYGRKATQAQLQSDLDGTGSYKSIFSFAPDIQRKLDEFHTFSTQSSVVGHVKLLNILTLGVRAKLLTYSLVRELEDLMYGPAQENKWNDAQMKRLDEMFFQNEEFIKTYILAVRDLAQFGTYEKLFSLWYVFHVPFVYMLVFSGIWHVVAVHMY